MTIYLAADHAGFSLKEKVKAYLRGVGYQVEDQGAFSLDPTDDYPDFVEPAAKLVAAEPETARGIIFGASGQGEAIVANRVKGVRAAVYYGGTEEIVVLSREHNNANILSLGAKFLTEEAALQVVKTWLATPFSAAERHVRRLEKIDGGADLKPF